MTDLTRRRNGSWVLTFRNGELTFDDDDAALAWFFEGFTTVGAARQQADKAATR